MGSKIFGEVQQGSSYVMLSSIKILHVIIGRVVVYILKVATCILVLSFSVITYHA